MGGTAENFDKNASATGCNEQALSAFLSGLYKEITARLGAEKEGQTIDPKIFVTLPVPVNAHDVIRLSAHSGLRSVCASPIHDFGLMITTLTDAAGKPLSTAVCVDMDQTYRSSMTQNTNTIRGQVEDHRIKGDTSPVLVIVFNQAVDIDGKSFKKAYIPPKVSAESKVQVGQSVEADIAPQTAPDSSLYVQKIKAPFSF